MTEDQLQDVCAGYLVSDQWRLSALAVAFLFVACGWMVDQVHLRSGQERRFMVSCFEVAEIKYGN